MRNNILKTLSNNLGFKILAVLFAFTLWLTVYNLEDPTKTVAFTINVTVENQEYVSSLGKYFEVEESSKKVSFSVTAARSVLDKLDESDFVATADMNYLAFDEGGASGTVPIEIICTDEQVSENAIKLSSTSKTMKVSIEDLMVKQFVVSAKAVGTVKEGYALGDVTVTAPNVLKVSGPKSIVQNIASVVATVNVDGMSASNATYRATPVLLDRNGREVDATRLTLDSTYVNVSTEILNTKEVAISVVPSGTPADGYVVTAISSNPTTIRLKGSKTLLNSINAIQIPSELISVAGAKEDVTVSIDVSEYIPEGAELVNANDATMEITVSIGKIKEKTFSINTENIIVTGLPTGWELEFALSSVAVNISGLEEDVNLLTSGNISGNIDVTDLPVGTHQVELILDLDETKYSFSTISISITITDPSAELEDEA